MATSEPQSRAKTKQSFCPASGDAKVLPCRVLLKKFVDETGSHIENPQYIAETFNEYFARIGHKMAESIWETPQKLPISQLHTSSANSFYMFPSSTDEVAQLIENLNDKKQ